MIPQPCCLQRQPLSVVVDTVVACVLVSKAVSTIVSPASDSDSGVGNDIENLDHAGTLTAITVSHSNEEYLLENDPDVSSSEHGEVDESDVAANTLPVK